MYAGAFSSSALSALRRKPTTGALRQLSGARGCIANRGPSRPAGCTVGRGLTTCGARDLRDGRWLYTGSGGDHNSGLAIFRRTTAAPAAR